MTLRGVLTSISTLGPLGYIPWAPGTMGSLISLLFLIIFKPPLWAHIIIAISMTTLGVWSSGEAEKRFSKKDPQNIIIDEASGYLIAMVFLPKTMGYYIASFILFRVLDILKPPPIRRLQGLSGGKGVMLDDVMAGVLTNIILEAWRLIAKNS